MVYLVGAGPGDAGLITCRGMELLQHCDAVIYDRLGTSELLEQIPADCEKIYVGKRAGAHYRSQDEINEILVETAEKYEIVVRLKGGDPFVFGRGGEEVLALQKNHIPFQLVPGVTSAVSVPELLGIPVTHRQTSRSFHVFTGHTKAGEENSLAHIHPEEGTSVFLMGLSHLPQIVSRLREQGQPADTPVSVLSGGTMPNEKRITGMLSDIEKKVRESGAGSPAIIVVGETAEYRFYSMEPDPLAGLKLAVVGTAPLREKLRMLLEKSRARLFSLVNMEVVPQGQNELIRELSQLEKYAWIGFTSQNAIRLFFGLVKKEKVDLRLFSHVKFAVVGSGTRDALLKEGFCADYMPDEYTTEALAYGLVEQMEPGERLLLPRALQGSVELTDILREHERDAVVIPLYDVKGNTTENWEYRENFDGVLFASRSGVEAFVEAIGEENLARWDKSRQEKGCFIGVIGKVTARALEKHGITADVIPAQCDLEHLVRKIEEKMTAKANSHDDRNGRREE